MNLFFYLKPEDDSPDETEGESGVAVDDVLGTDRLQPDLEVRNKQAVRSWGRFNESASAEIQGQDFIRIKRKFKLMHFFGHKSL
jgi:hypothetical protein